MKDITCKDLEIGNKILLITKNATKLSMCIILAFTSKKVEIQLTDKYWVYFADKCLKFPVQVAKV